MVAMTNDYDFAVTFFKVRRKINCKSSKLTSVSRDVALADACVLSRHGSRHPLRLPTGTVPERLSKLRWQ